MTENDDDGDDNDDDDGHDKDDDDGTTGSSLRRGGQWTASIRVVHRPHGRGGVHAHLIRRAAVRHGPGHDPDWGDAGRRRPDCDNAGNRDTRAVPARCRGESTARWVETAEAASTPAARTEGAARGAFFNFIF